jgi:hypothetical protein
LKKSSLNGLNIAPLISMLATLSIGSRPTMFAGVFSHVSLGLCHILSQRRRHKEHFWTQNVLFFLNLQSVKCVFMQLSIVILQSNIVGLKHSMSYCIYDHDSWCKGVDPKMWVIVYKMFLRLKICMFLMGTYDPTLTVSTSKYVGI